jgi:hypothetical protein
MTGHWHNGNGVDSDDIVAEDGFGFKVGLRFVEV